MKYLQVKFDIHSPPQPGSKRLTLLPENLVDYKRSTESCDSNKRFPRPTD